MGKIRDEGDPIPSSLILPARDSLNTFSFLRSPDRLAWLVVLLGGLLRVYNFTGMGLWIDEGYTIMFARMSWADVLGLHGAYDSHPPLYFASAKLFGLLFPELMAGRMMSVVCGTLTLPVIYLLARRVAGQWIALSATLLLAVSPLHIWYSQEARMYVPSMLFVALSYWALMEFLLSPRRKWAVLYGASVLAAMYFSYSSLYALAPQVVILALILRRHVRAAIPLLAALAVAVVAYLPWVPQWYTAIQDADPSRINYLGVSPQKVGTQLLEIAGLDDRGFYLSVTALPWEEKPIVYWIVAASAILVGAAGVAVLATKSKLALLLALVVWAGTVATAIVLSAVSPGFASRTTLYALLGWTILAGASVARSGRLPAWVSLPGLAGYALLLLFSLSSVGLIYTNAFKQDWASLGRDIASMNRARNQVLVVRPVDSTIIDAFEPGTLDGLILDDPSRLSDSTVWFPYHDSPRFAVYHQQLEAMGYKRVLHKYYFNPLYIDKYVKTP